MKVFYRTLLVAVVLFAWQQLVQAQQKSANDPVPALAKQRFEFKADGHSFTIPCDSNVALDKGDSSIEHAVFMVPGLLRQRHYHDAIMDALKLAKVTEGVAVISPQFLNKADVDAYKLGAEYPYWTNGGWGAGNNSLHDTKDRNAARVSSFTVMDKLLEDAVRRFPKLKTVTVMGFSAGGQYLNRYAAGNLVHDWVQARGIAVTYVVASPSSYLYFSDERAVNLEPLTFGPISKTEYADCKDFNTYRYGLLKMNQYMNRAGADRIPGMYASRTVVHMIGEKDAASATAHLATSCAAMLQGAHRLQRAEIYFGYLQHFFGEQIKENHSLVIVPGAGHSTRGMFVSKEGADVLVKSMARSLKARD